VVRTRAVRVVQWDRFDITFEHNKRQCIDFDLTVCMWSIYEKAYCMMAGK
jgi:hypothetical protein